MFENRRGFFFKIFFTMLSENIFSLNFCPPIFVTQSFAPNIYDKSTLVGGERKEGRGGSGGYSSSDGEREGGGRGVSFEEIG